MDQSELVSRLDAIASGNHARPAAKSAPIVSAVASTTTQPHLHTRDNPFNAPLEHALNIDFVNESQGPSARVAVELSEQAARDLVKTILAVLDRAELGGHL